MAKKCQLMSEKRSCIEGLQKTLMNAAQVAQHVTYAAIDKLQCCQRRTPQLMSSTHLHWSTQSSTQHMVDTFRHT